jgi:uncharacterized protein with PIN domain
MVSPFLTLPIKRIFSDAQTVSTTCPSPMERITATIDKCESCFGSATNWKGSHYHRMDKAKTKTENCDIS